MNWLRTIIHRPFCMLAVFSLGMVPQAPAQQRPDIREYIHSAWDSLSRSMSECKSVADLKVTTTPVLYLPAGMKTPSAVAAMQRQCNVQVEHLPRPIRHMGDVRVAEIPEEGLLYLPNRYVVPGGRFNEMYGWDSYFMVLGLVHDGREALAKGMVENLFFEIENYGAVLNANRTYFFTRSQPPLLSSMIREVYESRSDNGQKEKSRVPHSQAASPRVSENLTMAHDKAWLARAYNYAVRDHAMWTSPPHLAGDTGLARYIDIGEGPVPEMADDSTYYPDVIRWLLAHPDVHTNYLVAGPDAPTAEEAAALALTSCDIRVSRVCAAAHVDGHRLSRAFYRGDRAMRESGFDTSFRFGPFSGSTDQFAPVCLNSLLYKYERDLSDFAASLGRPQQAAHWKRVAAARKAAMLRYLWRPDTGMFYDYNFVDQHSSSYNFVTAFYPLWAGLATPRQAKSIESHLNIFEHEGGLAMSDNESGTQWDLPYGWAPTNWFAASGLTQYGYKDDAKRIAAAFTHTVEVNYVADGTIREKYNVVSGSANIKVAAGYKANVVGFGWTNGVYLCLRDLR